MPSTYSDLHVVVTGGSGALGRAVVQRLLEAGAACHVPVFDDSELTDWEPPARERLRIATGIDLGNEEQAVAYYGSLPGLWASIHCAGGFAMQPLADTDLESFERLMRLNATTCFLSCREAVRRIRGRQGGPAGGRLVNVTARPALDPRSGAGMVAYTAAKSAVAALTVALGEELADEEIWVNAVAPAILDSPANRRAMPDADTSTWASPADVAEAIGFLSSPQNRTVRSALVPVYGRA